MRNTIFLTLLLVLSSCSQTPRAQAQEANESWFKCSTDSECVWEEALCGKPSAVRRDFQEQFKSNIRIQSRMVRCAPLCRQPEKTEELRKLTKEHVQCFSGKCQICLPEALSAEWFQACHFTASCK